MAKLELSAVLGELRKEITKAQLSAEGEDLRFKVKDIEVELQTVVDWEVGGEGGGKIKFWVLDIDAKGNGKYKNSTTHKIKVSLTPTDANGQPVDLLLNDDE